MCKVLATFWSWRSFNRSYFTLTIWRRMPTRSIERCSSLVLKPHADISEHLSAPNTKRKTKPILLERPFKDYVPLAPSFTWEWRRRNCAIFGWRWSLCGFECHVGVGAATHSFSLGTRRPMLARLWCGTCIRKCLLNSFVARPDAPGSFTCPRRFYVSMVVARCAVDDFDSKQLPILPLRACLILNLLFYSS